MATQDWRTGIDLKQAVAEAPESFELFQLLRVIDGLLGNAGPSAGGDPGRAGVRFQGSLEPGFPNAAVGAATEFPAALFDAPQQAAPAAAGAARPQGRIGLAALSFGGPQGPMPDSLMQELRDRARAGDTGAAAFLDIFIHRLATLMWRTRQATRPELETRMPQDSPGGRAVLAMAGLMPAATRDRLPVPDGVLMRYAPLLARRPVSAEALRRMAADDLGAEVRVTPLQGRWLARAPDELTRLGRRDGTARLGQTTFLGTHAWTQTGGLDLDVGPLDGEAFRALLPGRSRHDRLRGLVGYALNQPMHVTATLRLRHDAVPPLHLTRAESGARLGWTTWLGRGLDIGRQRTIGVRLLSSGAAVGAMDSLGKSGETSA
jgi:type VI secretion system protein ImpH